MATQIIKSACSYSLNPLRHPTQKELYRMFQARMWREYAMAWDGRKTMTGVGREWVEKVLRVPRKECLKRAREALQPKN